jgi:hypothetical protein
MGCLSKTLVAAGCQSEAIVRQILPLAQAALGEGSHREKNLHDSPTEHQNAIHRKTEHRMTERQNTECRMTECRTTELRKLSNIKWYLTLKN